MRHVISLSTIPPRFNAIGPCLHSLLRQKVKAEAIELYIPRSYRRFPAWGGGLPDVPEGVTIVRVDEDLGPATKVLPAAFARRGQDIDLFYCDDDRVYGPEWTETGLRLRQRHRRAALCGNGFSIREKYGYDAPDRPRPRMLRPHQRFLSVDYQLERVTWLALRAFGIKRPKPKLHRTWRAGYSDIAFGYGGVMVRPEFFGDEARVIPPAIWAVDDIWLSGMMAQRGIPVWVDRTFLHILEETEAGAAEPLFQAVIENLDRDAANRACIDYLRSTYGIWGGSASQST